MNRMFINLQPAAERRVNPETVLFSCACRLSTG
jgi:hypothetical protein